MIPPNKSLGTRNASISCGDLRLLVELKFIAFQRKAHLPLNLLPAMRRFVEALIKEAEFTSFFFFCFVERHVGTF